MQGRGTVQLLSSCPSDQKACVPMLFDLSNPPAVMRSERPASEKGYTVFELELRARVGDRPPVLQRFSFRGFTGGTQCSAFGQGSIATVGFTERDEPIVLSSVGAVVLLSPVVMVGCKDCLRQTGAASAFRSPSWDLSLTGQRTEDFAFLRSGEPVLKVQGGCIVLRDRFKLLAPDQCTAQIDAAKPVEVATRACS